MKSVQHLYADAFAMQREGVPPNEITSRLIDLGQDNGFSNIELSGSGSARWLKFEPTGEVIRYDGASWYYEPGPPGFGQFASRTPRGQSIRAGRRPCCGLA